MKNTFFLHLIGAVSSLLLISYPAYSQEIAQTINTPNYQRPKLDLTPNLPPRESYTGIVKKIDDIAQKITVKIDSLNPDEEEADGSGVIIARKGNIYYVLTAFHVICIPKDSQCQEHKHFQNYQIITPDGKSYPVDYSKVKSLEGIDIAVVQFESKDNYQVATLADYEIGSNYTQWTFLSGFPISNHHSSKPKLTIGKAQNKENSSLFAHNVYTFAFENSKNNPNDQRKKPIERYELTLFNKQYDDFYGLLYSNISYRGMSGGAVLDHDGQLIGINTGEEGNLFGLGYGVSVSVLLKQLSKTTLTCEMLKINNNPLSIYTTNDYNTLLKFSRPVEIPNNNSSAEDWIKYGNQLWRTFNYAESIIAYDKAINKKTSSDKAYYAYYGKGLALKAQESYEQALVTFRKASLLSSSYEVWREISNIYELLKQYDKALQAINQAIIINQNNKIQPLDFYLYYYKARILGWLKKNEEAENTLQIVLGIKKHSRIYHIYGSILLIKFLNNLENTSLAKKSLTFFEKSLVLDNTNADGWLLKGLLLEMMKQNEEAFSAYYNSIFYDPSNHEAWYGAGVTLVNLDKYKEALNYFEGAIKIKPNYYNAWNYKGSILYRLRKYNEAVNAFDKALAIRNDLYDAWTLRGNALDDIGRSQEALESYTKAIKIKPDYRFVWYDQGVTLHRLGRYEESIAAYDKAISIYSNYYEAWDAKGISLNKLGKYEEAIIAYDKALTIAPRHVISWIGKGNTLVKLEKYNEAVSAYKKALSIDPDNYITWSNKGLALDKLRRYEEAIIAYDKALNINPKLPLAWFNKGFNLVILARYREAIESYTQAIKLKPDYMSAYLNRGLAYRQLGNKQKAIADLQTSVQI